SARLAHLDDQPLLRKRFEQLVRARHHHDLERVGRRALAGADRDRLRGRTAGAEPLRKGRADVHRVRLESDDGDVSEGWAYRRDATGPERGWKRELVLG